MIETVLLSHCAPTLAGLKMGNLFSYLNIDDTCVETQIAIYNSLFENKDLKMLLLQKKQDRSLVLVYRPKMVAQYLQQGRVKQFLLELGYPSCISQEALQHLSLRLRSEKDFPHEVGIFLGYPFEDVCSFIRNKGCNGLCDGCWKVYSNVASAQKKFMQFKKCTAIYQKHYAKGRKLQDLAVRRMEI